MGTWKISIFILSLIIPSSLIASMNEFNEYTVTLKPYIEVPGFGFSYKADDAKEISLAPNTRTVTGLAFTLNGVFGVGAGFKNAMTSEDQQRKGDTVYQDWRFKFSLWKIYFSTYYQEYTGLFIENSTDVDTNLSGSDPFIQLENMRVRNVSINSYWIQDEDSFSIVAALDQSVRQEKSGGSWIIGFAANEMEFSNSGRMIPEQVRDDYGADKNIISGRFQSLSISGGYGYTFVLNKKWFASGMVMLGFGLRNSTYKVGDESRVNSKNSSKADAIISTGYNGDKFLSGLSIYGETNTYSTRSLEISGSLYALQLFIGTRI